MSRAEAIIYKALEPAEDVSLHIGGRRGGEEEEEEVEDEEEDGRKIRQTRKMRKRKRTRLRCSEVGGRIPNGAERSSWRRPGNSPVNA